MAHLLSFMYFFKKEGVSNYHPLCLQIRNLATRAEYCTNKNTVSNTPELLHSPPCLTWSREIISRIFIPYFEEEMMAVSGEMEPKMLLFVSAV